MDLPLIRPNPPRLSRHVAALEAIEDSGTFSNNGPVARRLEAEMTDRLFGGRGACLTVANATLGLMLALRHATHAHGGARPMALMPAFTFAATAHAAIWAGLTPLLADCDPDDWALSAFAEERLLAEHGRRIGAIVPYATFGNSIDLERYAWLARRHDVAVVVDAAASLGSLDSEGRGFGTDCPFPVVYSMHATKTFATSEGGIIHSCDTATIETLRAMANFGFAGSRSATMPGLNAKLAEVNALIACEKLAEIDAIATHRETLHQRYRTRLAAFSLQRPCGHRQAMQFMPVLLPRALAGHRAAIVAALGEAGIGAGTYFSPHLAEQPYFREVCAADRVPVTDDIAARMLVLPITDDMGMAEVDRVADALIAICARLPRAKRARNVAPRDRVLGAVIVGGGPAGSALLCAAGKAGRLDALARAGIAILDRGEGIGGGRLGGYEITSDSTAETFLSADGALPAGLALSDDPAARAIRDHAGGLGVPLPKVGAYLDRLGEALGQRLTTLGGDVLTGHEVTGAQRGPDGLWRVRARRIADGQSLLLTTRTLVVATGGSQPAIRLAEERVAGMSLVECCGDRLIQSDTLLATGGIEAMAKRLPASRPARIAIVGGSTSAVTAAVRLLKARGAGITLGEGSIALIHRRPLRPFYPSAEAAHADGFTDFGREDICPVSGFVYRLAGFRLEARELVVHALGIGGRVGDPRLRLHQLTGGQDETAATLLDSADLVVAAFGYRPHALPLTDAAGCQIRLRADGPVRGPMVDDQCRLVDAEGHAIPGVFGIGLAAGFVPMGRLGGERSFRGQANGLWLWQNDVGALIVDHILADRHERRASAVA